MQMERAKQDSMWTQPCSEINMEQVPEKPIGEPIGKPSKK